VSENTKIEWCDHTFNPWRGCTPVSPGCLHCYAAALSKRTGGPEYKRGVPRWRTKTWGDPVRWNKAAAGASQRPRVFCASLADWLDDEVPIEWLKDLLCLIAKCPNLDFLLLTKRPENFAKRVAEVAEGWRSSCELAVWWTLGIEPANVWIGTTVEDQKRADERIPLLLQIPARVRFLSCEPLLEKVELGTWFFSMMTDAGKCAINWVIAGGESGPGARPMHPEWARSLRDQCRAAHVPFLFKQWGEYAPREDWQFAGLDNPKKAGQWTKHVVISSTDRRQEGKPRLYAHDSKGRAVLMDKVGKKAAGRLLDGEEWNEFPKP